MANVLQNPADIINASLVRIGYGLQIGNLYDGSKAAQKSLAIYGETRDSLLRISDWGFAQRMISLTVLKTAPASYVPGVTPWDPTTYPQLNFRFEYAWPDDCLKVRSLRPTPIFIPNFDPSPNVFAIANDNTYAPPQRVILSSLANAVCVYTGQVTDPLTMPPDFIEGLIGMLGEKLAAGLTSESISNTEAAEGRADTAMATMEQG